MSEEKKNPKMEWGFYAVVPRIVRTQYKDIGPSEKWLYTCLKDLCGDKGACFRTLAKLSEETGLSTGSLSTMIPILHDAGLIHAEKKARGLGGKKVWHISIVDIWQSNREYCSKSEELPSVQSSKSEEPQSIVQNLNDNLQNLNDTPPYSSKSERSSSNFVDRRITNEEQRNEERTDEEQPVVVTGKSIGFIAEAESNGDFADRETRKPAAHKNASLPDASETDISTCSVEKAFDGVERFDFDEDDTEDETVKSVVIPKGATHGHTNGLRPDSLRTGDTDGLRDTGSSDVDTGRGCDAAPAKEQAKGLNDDATGQRGAADLLRDADGELSGSHHLHPDFGEQAATAVSSSIPVTQADPLPAQRGKGVEPSSAADAVRTPAAVDASCTPPARSVAPPSQSVPVREASIPRRPRYKPPVKEKSQLTLQGEQVRGWYDTICGTKVRLTEKVITACNNLADEDGMSYENLKAVIELWDADTWAKAHNKIADLPELDSGYLSFSKGLLALKRKQRNKADPPSNGSKPLPFAPSWEELRRMPV